MWCVFDLGQLNTVVAIDDITGAEIFSFHDVQVFTLYGNTLALVKNYSRHFSGLIVRNKYQHTFAWTK